MNQFVLVRKKNPETSSTETVPCWVPVLVPITHPVDAYKKYQVEFDDFVTSHTGDGQDEEKVTKEFHLLLDEWRDSNPILFSVNEIVTFARELDADSFEVTSTYFSDLEDVVVGYHGSVIITFKKEEGVEDA